MGDASCQKDKIFSFDTPFRDPLRKGLFYLVRKPLEKTLCLSRLNKLYLEILDEGRFDSQFADLALERLNVRYEIRGRGLAPIPDEGALVVVANHPFGGIEGLMLASLLRQRRQDVKIMANYLLAGIPELRDVLLYVDPFEKKDSVAKNLLSLRKGIDWLKDGHVLAVFPAGSVSRLSLQDRKVSDPEWNYNVARIVRRSHATVLPVFFEGTNSALFQAAGLVHPKLRTALLPRELLNKKNKPIGVRIGTPLPFKKLASFADDRKLTGYLRMRTYALGAGSPKAGRMGRIIPLRRTVALPHQVVAPEPEQQIVGGDVDRLPGDQLLLKTGEYGVFYARAEQIPNLLVEIGRLREITFRAAHEGTGKALDLDRFDDHYTHLFVWNFEKRHVVGAYRIGQVDTILSRWGKNGLYTSTLFDYKGPFLEQMEYSIELGRSFIRREYQKLYAPLLLLWKGIGHFVALHPQYTTLFGPVSISSAYSNLSRQLMMAYLRVNHYEPNLARLVKARSGVRDFRKVLGLKYGELIPQNLEELSSLISEIEEDRKGIPVLLRQYVKLGGRLMGFNVDQAFGHALDGLIIVDLLKCDEKILERYMGCEGLSRFLCYHEDILPEYLAS